MIYKEERPKSNLALIWRIGLDLAILVAMWLAKGHLLDWAQQPWQKALLSGLAIVTILDIVSSARNTVSHLVKRISAAFGGWRRSRRRETDIPVKAITSVDQPIISLTDDQLGFAKYAYILADFVAHCDTPMTVGIHGEWGSGKSSLANMIWHFLRERKADWDQNDDLQRIRHDLANNKCDLDRQLPNDQLAGLEIIDLNAWQYASAQSLWRALILRLSQRLEEKGLSSDSDEWQRKLYYSVSQEEKGEIRLSGTAIFAAGAQAVLTYAGTLLLPSTWLLLALQATGISTADKFGVSSFDGLLERQKYSSMRKQMESIEEFQGALRMLVDRLLNRRPGETLRERRVIFFIDDLDRCLPTVALEIMETIKTFLDVPGCVYILLCDNQLLGQGVKAKFKEMYSDVGEAYQRRGREYVEKLIQISFQIPPSNRESLKGFAEAALSDLYVDKTIPYFEVVYATVADNPRKVKRLCRGLELAFDMMELSIERPSQGTRSGVVVPDPDVTSKSSNTNPESPGQTTQTTETLPLANGKTRINKSIVERKREFAKVYCLQYGWPDALALLRSFQAVRDSFVDSVPIPAAITAMMNVKRPEDRLSTEQELEQDNMIQAYEELTYLLELSDSRIFRPLLVSVDWEKARVEGKGAVRQLNPDLWRFLSTEPYFVNIDSIDLKDYIEWSAVIPGEEPAPAEASGPVSASSPPLGVLEPELPQDLSEEERRLHNDARRFARLLVSEIKIYNEPKIREGRSNGDLYDRLREEIDRSRQMYDKRVAAPVAARHDYFHQELVNLLAEGDAGKLGQSYPGAIGTA